MKSIFKLLLIIFTLTITLLLEPSTLQSNNIDISGTINHPDQETYVLVSSNAFNGEIRNVQDENSTNFTGSSLTLISNSFNENSFNKYNPSLLGSFIHNLSTNKHKVHQIRAP